MQIQEEGRQGKKKGMDGRDAHESSSSAKVWNQLWRRKHKWIPSMEVAGWEEGREGRNGMRMRNDGRNERRRERDVGNGGCNGAAVVLCTFTLNQSKPLR